VENGNMAAVGQPQQAMSMPPASLPAGLTREQIQQTFQVCLFHSPQSLPYGAYAPPLSSIIGLGRVLTAANVHSFDS
jgi:hypothetical protein